MRHLKHHHHGYDVMASLQPQPSTLMQQQPVAPIVDRESSDDLIKVKQEVREEEEMDQDEDEGQ